MQQKTHSDNNNIIINVSQDYKTSLKGQFFEIKIFTLS